MYALTKHSIAAGIYGKDSLIACESMLRLQTRAIKQAVELVKLNPNSLTYDRTRKGGVITIRVFRKPIGFDVNTWGAKRLANVSVLATWRICKLVVLES